MMMIDDKLGKMNPETLERYQMSQAQFDEAHDIAMSLLRKGGTKADFIHGIEERASCMKVAITAAIFVGHMLDQCAQDR